MSTAPSAEVKLRTLAAADSTMQAIFGPVNAFRWFDLQLAQQSVARPVTPVSANPVYMAVHRVSTQTVRNQGGVTDLEQVRLQLTIISYSSENAKQAAVAVKNFMNTISLVDNGMFSSPVTTPTQNPNSLLNQRSGMMSQLHPPAYSYMQDWRIFNRTDIQTTPTPPLPPGVGVALTTDPTNGLTSLSWRGASFFYGAQPNPSFVNVIQSDGTHLQTNPTSSTTNTSTNTTTQTFPWGTAVTQYTASGDNLLLTVTISNSTGLDIDKYWMFPLGLAFPSMPANINTNAAFNMDAPSSIFNTYSIGGNDLVNEDFNSPVALGYWPTTSPVNANWLVSLYVDPQHALNNSWPPIIRPIVAGSSVTFNLSIRFGASGSTELSLAGNVFTRFGATYSKQTLALNTTKPIARLSFTSNVRPFPATNPRGWFGADSTVDVTTPSGIAAFQTRLLAAANSAITEMTRMGVSGGILWDMEGQEFQSGISYIGDPSQAETVAPELVGVFDTFVNKFKTAGFRIGFTLRPQVFANTTGVVNVSGTTVTWVSGSQFSPSWVGDPTGGYLTVGTNNYAIVSATATSITLATSAGNLTGVPYAYPTQTYPVDPHAVLDSKAHYAVNRWGATLFYCDSTVYDNAVTPAAAFQQLAATYPGALYIPEWKLDEHYAYSLPWIDPRLAGQTAPGQRVLYSYPTAQGCVYMTDDSPSSSFVTALTNSVRAGNVIIFDGWYRHPANDVILSIYQTVYP